MLNTLGIIREKEKGLPDEPRGYADQRFFGRSGWGRVSLATIPSHLTDDTTKLRLARMDSLPAEPEERYDYGNSNLLRRLSPA
uniref:Uncharacterized protein n=1 Tax=Candidatus Kentrum sp. FW TaxID=2126338 RepID=A0A450TUY8_9GAMM|nr:MAG: hypothetical protein BECKFW1821C_GA0114237_10386 [Candidatus Kentron sp. FW]